MAQFQILTKIEDGAKIAINIDQIRLIEDYDGCTLICLYDGEEIEVHECIDDIFPNSDTPRYKDKKTPFIPIKLSSN